MTDVVASGAVPAVGHSEAGEDELAQAVDRGLGARHAPVERTDLSEPKRTVARSRPRRAVPGIRPRSPVRSSPTAGTCRPPCSRSLAAVWARRLVIVSDATPGAGLPEGAGYRLGVVDCRVRDGVGIVAEGSSFGGSTTTLGEMVAYLHRDLGGRSST